jgi:NCAIR mutase (PurE)-related protein
MNRDDLRNLLASVADGSTAVDAAIDALRAEPVANLGFAHVDTHRAIRCGYPEVIFCQGKTPEQARTIARVVYDKCGGVLATRADAQTRTAIKDEFAGVPLDENETARAIFVGEVRARPCVGEVLVISAGTSDIPVAEEAAFTVKHMGSPVRTLFDVGVAGIHRLMGSRDVIQSANVLIVVAGMEGALASVIGGLVDRPVVAVPTSIGYGASFGGIAALLSMLNSCAAGVSVVNIDNGFGAGYVASLINEARTARANHREES